MQKTSTSQQQQQKDDDNDEQMPLLKVPKLTLKLSKPYEKPVDSEQSSTESDSGSDNENDDEENDNDNANGMSTEMNCNDLNQHDLGIPSTEYPFSSGEQQQQQPQHFQQHEQYAYDANNSLLDVSDRFAENANDSGSSEKNTSTDSMDDKITQHTDDNQYPAQFENDTSTQIPSALPLASHAFHPNDGSTASTDIGEQRNLTVDAITVANLSVSISFITPIQNRIQFAESILRISFDNSRIITIQQSNPVRLT